MKKDFEYIVRYDDEHKITTLYCTDIYNMQDVTETLERLGCLYVVIKVKKDDENHVLFKLRCLTDFKDLFKEEDDE